MGKKSRLKKQKQHKAESITAPVKLHNFASVLLSDFAKCLQGDYSGLTISGQPTKEQTAEAWEDIMIDYKDTTADRYERMLTRYQCDIIAFEAKKAAVYHLLDLLEMDGYNQAYIDVLKGLGYHKEKPDLEEYIRYVKAVLSCDETRLSRAYHALKERATELERLSAEVGEIGEVYFIKLLTRMSRAFKYKLEYKGMLLAEYCQHYKDYAAMIEEHNKQIEQAKTTTHGRH